MKTCALICNPESGKSNKKIDIVKIGKLLEKYDYQYKLYITKKAGDATNFIKNMAYTDLVLSIGGDGTFNEILNGNYSRTKKLVLSHIPVGTTNDMGNMLGLKKNILKNLEDILNGEIKKIDIGLINNTPFAYVCGFGKFINVPYNTSRKLKKSFGYLAYIINGAKEFFQNTKLYELEYEVNGEKHTGLYSLIIISNANRIAGMNNIYKDIKLDDNMLEIVFCNITRRKDLVKTLILLAKYGITSAPGLYCYSSGELNIKFKEDSKKSWTIDGEKLKDNKMEYNIKISQDTKMLLPKHNLKKLFVK